MSFAGGYQGNDGLLGPGPSRVELLSNRFQRREYCPLGANVGVRCGGCGRITPGRSRLPLLSGTAGRDAQLRRRLFFIV